MESDSVDSVQWTDMTEALNGLDQRRTNNTSQDRVNPFSDTVCDGEILQLQNLETCDASSARPKGFVAEHPSWKPSQSTGSHVSYCLKPILQDEDYTNSEWETVAPDEDVILKPSINRGQRVQNAGRSFQAHDSLDRVGQLAERTQYRNTAFIPTTSSRNLGRAMTMLNSNRPKHASQWPRASSVYEDDTAVDKSQRQDWHPETFRTLAQNRPATLGFGRNAQGELVASYSKSSSRASNDPFKFDGADYSVFLQPSAEKEVSRALYRAEASSEALSTRVCSPQRGEQQSLRRQFQPGSFYDNAAIQST
ncbi:uncharacterized protein MAM_05369 [Metarhizium album ARSEF 1941]|uniref:Uncharacterized protein n=1 Tax=Metarhizium album (strain ARSEF 1941) TaxID=1081103 RepID=A0A0B2WS17_METAS|nr:uncharacterized protein MAM_05369 [Metarhizium album ARSEF 1941]KHN96813.1 hypothetical protein MAM_05369 [Metarhizium album ARSEF 1941]